MIKEQDMETIKIFMEPRHPRQSFKPRHPRQNFTDPRHPRHPLRSLTHITHEATHPCTHATHTTHELTAPTLFSRLFIRATENKDRLLKDRRVVHRVTTSDNERQRLVQ